VISQPIKPGRRDDVRRWQDTINRAVAMFPGYLGNDISVLEDEGGDWAVIYRFDSVAHLDLWMSSPEREVAISQGAVHFGGPDSQFVFMSDPDADAVTVVVAHAVDPAQEEAFVAWQERVTDIERTFPGFRGSELFRPVPGVQDQWTIMYRFDTDAHVTAWINSPERQQLLDEGEQFQDFKLRRVGSPFGSWFSPTPGSGDGGGPAHWKTAISVLIGLYPTVVLLTLCISHIWKSAALWESILLGNIVSVALLTWVVMPVITRALGFWLVPKPGRGGPRLDALGAAASLAILTLTALVLWLVTTQIWHLP
jgi:antibiotic biosynthesis monooxygenase (ABM) superfamily enzyme